MLGLPILTGSAIIGPDASAGDVWHDVSTTLSTDRYLVTRDASNDEWVMHNGTSSGSNMFRSGDGVAWSSASVGILFYDLRYINSTIGTLACGRLFNGSTFDAKVYRSTGGAWAEVYSTDVGTNPGAVSIITDGTTAFVGIHNAGSSLIVSSTDGTTWSTSTTLIFPPLYRTGMYNGSRIAFTGAGNNVAYTDNGGSSWSTAAVTGLSVNTGSYLMYAEGANGYFLSTNGGNIYRSSDAISWSVASTQNARGLAYNPDLGRWVAALASSPYAIYSDDDGATWSNPTTAPTQVMRAVAYDSVHQQYIIVSETANSSGVWVSPDN